MPKLFSTSKEGKKLATIFEDYMKKNVKSDTMSLLLSSGMDSASVGFAATRLGIKINSYTFQLGETTSFDAKHAERVADLMGWGWELIKVPDDSKSLKSKLSYMKNDLKCVKKVDYECIYPMLYVYPHIEDKYVGTGLIADGYFVYSRRANIERIGGPNSIPELFHEHRRKYWKKLLAKGFDGLKPVKNNPSGVLQHELILRANKQVHINPFIHKPTHDFFLRYDWLQLNKPMQKRFLVEAYAPECNLVGRRNHRSYNSEAKITSVFEKLLDSRTYNPNKRIRVLDMVRDWDNYDIL